MMDARKQKICNDFGENLKKIRLAKGLALRELAARAGLEHAQIARIEDGDVNPTLTTVYFLAEALEMAPCDLLARS